MTKETKWPIKPKLTESYNDFDNGFQSGQRNMHDKFMEVIKARGTTRPEMTVEEIEKVISQDWNCLYSQADASTLDRTIIKIAQAIHQALKERK